ncbi:class I SAM-dependent methyltransferase [Pseudoxanthomonas sp. JBR18]|uniref:class I SAM-dependent DNA methyltransferase n=1 Tax=Pseudoxanthomonas sp. JBR18 TaxID=2969308 RepID=UPI0023059A37|nr:class I SAM-dependent methyltransferase [Pseudoxanthomonas sp. JBR18]WCE03872.1 class I SAM-dependent methyltransferase [Pseudoxanthomonas sp. JBR18]
MSQPSQVAERFDAIHAQLDPFGYRTRWYERRKRDLVLACLPQPSFSRGWEIGCSMGELSAALAARCDALLATDASSNALFQARARHGALANVRFEQAIHPGDWPTGAFDLIVLSEIGYYLAPSLLVETIERIGASLTPDGVLVACHWKPAFEGAYQDGAQVHQEIGRTLALPAGFRYEDSDFLLEGWSQVSTSVAQREGLR